MSRQDSYIWTIGYRDNGSPIIGGAYMDMDDAQEATSHLNRVQFIRLGTRDRNAAIPQLRDRIQSGGPPSRSRESGGGGVGVLHRSRIISRILHRNRKPERADTDADDTSPG